MIRGLSFSALSSPNSNRKVISFMDDAQVDNTLLLQRQEPNNQLMKKGSIMDQLFIYEEMQFRFFWMNFLWACIE